MFFNEATVFDWVGGGFLDGFEESHSVYCWLGRFDRVFEYRASLVGNLVFDVRVLYRISLRPIEGDLDVYALDGD